MRTTRLPTSEEIQQVTSFLPVLYAEGFEPEVAFRGAISSPEYDPAVYAFFSLLSQECWSDYDYLRKDPASMLRRPGAVEQATLDEVKTMLTFCKRRENFCGGFWAGVIANGSVRRLLDRLIKLSEQARTQDEQS